MKAVNKLLRTVHILSSQWYDSHIMFCTLSGFYCCFPFSPNMFWCWLDIILFKEIKSRSQVGSFCSALVHRPYMKHWSRLLLQALPWPLTNFWPLLQLPPLSFSCISFLVLVFTLSLRIPIQTCSSVAEESFLSVCPTHFHSCTLLIWGESACFLLMSLMWQYIYMKFCSRTRKTAKVN